MPGWDLSVIAGTDSKVTGLLWFDSFHKVFYNDVVVILGNVARNRDNSGETTAVDENLKIDLMRHPDP